MDENSADSFDLVTEFEIKAEQIEGVDIKPEPETENSTIQVRTLSIVSNYQPQVSVGPEPVLMEDKTLAVVEESKIPSFFIKHSCRICRDKFKSKRDLIHHMTIHDPELRFKCQICTMRFQTPYKLFKHTMTHTKCVITCPHCQIKVNNAEELEQHDAAVHQWPPEQRAECPKCLMILDSKQEFDEHFSDHDRMCKFECIPCRKGFLTRKTFQRHMDNHQPQEFTCMICSAAFDSRLELRLHEKTHVFDAPHKCTKCTASFFKKCHLVYHCRESHRTLVKLNPASAERPFICIFCGDAFKKLGGLRMHCSSIHRQSYAFIADNLQSATSQSEVLAYSNQTVVFNSETRPTINTVGQVQK